MVLIISTPCTGMKGFSAINRVKNREAWLKSRRMSTPLANLGGHAAQLQMSDGRHFIAEHPQGSDMWSMDIWKQLARMNVVVAMIHQCMAGLKGSKSGLPVMKPTQFMASDEALVAHLRDLRCDGRHPHAQLDNPAGAAGDKARDAARWPPQLCHRLARGVEDLLRGVKRRTMLTVVAAKAEQSSDFPLSTRTRASQNFPGSSSDGSCLGCRRNRIMTDSEHSRIPGQCRFPHIEPVVWDFQAAVNEHPPCRNVTPTFQVSAGSPRPDSEASAPCPPPEAFAALCPQQQASRRLVCVPEPPLQTLQKRSTLSQKLAQLQRHVGHRHGLSP